MAWSPRGHQRLCFPKHPLTLEDITNYGKFVAWCAETGRFRAAAELQQYLQNTTYYCPPLVWLEAATPAQRSLEVRGNVSPRLPQEALNITVHLGQV